MIMVMDADVTDNDNEHKDYGGSDKSSRLFLSTNLNSR